MHNCLKRWVRSSKDRFFLRLRQVDCLANMGDLAGAILSASQNVTPIAHSGFAARRVLASFTPECHTSHNVYDKNRDT